MTPPTRFRSNREHRAALRRARLLRCDVEGVAEERVEQTLEARIRRARAVDGDRRVEVVLALDGCHDLGLIGVARERVRVEEVLELLAEGTLGERIERAVHAQLALEDLAATGLDGRAEPAEVDALGVACVRARQALQEGLEVMGRRDGLALQLGHDLARDGRHVVLGTELDRTTAREVDSPELDLTARHLAEPRDERPEAHLRLVARLHLGDQRVLLGDAVVGDRDREDDELATRCGKRAQEARLRRHEAPVAAAGALDEEHERLVVLHEQIDGGVQLAVGLALAALDVEGAGPLEDLAEQRDLRELLRSGDPRRLDAELRPRKAEQRDEHEVHVAAVRGHHDDERIARDVRDRSLERRVVEGDLVDAVAQALLHDHAERAHRGVAARLLKGEAEVALLRIPLAAERCAARIATEQVVADTRAGRRDVVETVERGRQRQRRAEVERVVREIREGGVERRDGVPEARGRAGLALLARHLREGGDSNDRRPVQRPVVGAEAEPALADPRERRGLVVRVQLELVEDEVAALLDGGGVAAPGDRVTGSAARRRRLRRRHSAAVGMPPRRTARCRAPTSDPRSRRGGDPCR